MGYKIINQDEYYRNYAFERFTKQTHCSMAMTSKVDVTELITYSKNTNTKFYINCLYLIGRVINGNENYRMDFNYDTQELICWDKMNLTHFLFFNETKRCTPVFTEYDENYEVCYQRLAKDIDEAKKNPQFSFKAPAKNYFDASFMPWITFDAFAIELPDGYPYFIPIINWCKYECINGRYMMPVAFRMNHAVADGYLMANFYLELQKEIDNFVKHDKEI